MAPSTLQEAILYFAEPANCREYLVARRWPNGVECPYCASKQVSFSEKYNRWQCSSHHKPEVEGEKAKPRQFTLKTGTIFEESPIGLDKWLLTMWQVVNCKNGVSSYEIARAIGVTQKSAWFMLHRLRDVMQDANTGGMLGGEVEVDETFIGGKARNMHSDKRAEKIKGRGPEGKAIVAAVLERGGKVRARVMDSRKKKALQKLVNDNGKPGSRSTVTR